MDRQSSRNTNLLNRLHSSPPAFALLCYRVDSSRGESQLGEWCLVWERQRLLFLLERVEVGNHIRARPVLRAYDFAVDAPVGIDDVGFRIHRGAVVKCDLMIRRVAIGGEIDAVSLQ